jgi:alpha-amylase
MASVCLYLQMHQPPRLRRYSVFDTTSDYFDDHRNAFLLQRIAAKCYIPMANLLLDLIEKHGGKFRVALSITGSLIDQFKEHSPQTIALYQKLAKTGCVEFLSETYHHSLAFMFSRDEFRAQIALHRSMIEALFGQTPRVFRNTELIYSNELARYIEGIGGYDGVLAEGIDPLLGTRTPNAVYRAGGSSMKLLLKNYRLSDDIAFRFSNRSWNEWPLTAEKFAQWIDQGNAQSNSGICGIFMDMETFGEHQWAETGIFDFLAALPDKVLAVGGGRNHFKTPSECLQSPAVDEYNVPHMTSWADTERDVSAWLGNAMQSNALHELYRMEPAVKACEDTQVLDDWRKLTASDHYYYMCTKYFADGDVHKYFNPYESPYDSYINFMNVLDNLRQRIEAGAPTA